MIRIPRLTCVSEGKPFRRLLLGVKGLVGVYIVFHGKLQSENLRLAQSNISCGNSELRRECSLAWGVGANGFRDG